MSCHSWVNSKFKQCSSCCQRRFLPNCISVLCVFLGCSSSLGESPPRVEGLQNCSHFLIHRLDQRRGDRRYKLHFDMGAAITNKRWCPGAFSRAPWMSNWVIHDFSLLLCTAAVCACWCARRPWGSPGSRSQSLWHSPQARLLSYPQKPWNLAGARSPYGWSPLRHPFPEQGVFIHAEYLPWQVISLHNQLI